MPFFMALFAICPSGGAGLAAGPGGAGVPAFPVISRLDPGDAVFSQYQADVENARRLLYGRARPVPSGRTGSGESPDAPQAASAGSPLAEAFTVYEYTVKGEDLFDLASRCNIPYAAIATLNRLPHVRELAEGATLYLPSVPGLFIPEKPENDLELLMGSSRDAENGFFITVRRGDGAGERFLFIPGADFRSTERTFFLTGGFRFPLGNFRLTSGFGPRINPVTGNLRIHQGLDLAAPLGTDVRAARDGIVTETGDDPVYGKYVIIEHSGNWTSLYGHLSEINTVLRKSVKSGNLIGRVGSTGQSTGPHLHFELRQHGKAQDPDNLLFRRSRTSQ